MSGTLDAIDRSSCKIYDCPRSLQVSSPLADGSTVPFRMCPWAFYLRFMARDENNFIAEGIEMAGEVQTNETCASRNDHSSSWQGVYGWRIQHWTSSSPDCWIEKNTFFNEERQKSDPISARRGFWSPSQSIAPMTPWSLIVAVFRSFIRSAGLRQV